MYEVIYTALPDRGKEPLPPANLSLISPPLPVAEPLNASTVVGKLCVSAFIEITDLKDFFTYSLGKFPSKGANCSILGPSIKATLSLYAEIIELGLILDVFFIISNKLNFLTLSSIENWPLNILCLQCSELTCEKPKTSESVSFLFSFLERPSKYSISSTLSARPSSILKRLISLISFIFSGTMLFSKIF